MNVFPGWWDQQRDDARARELSADKPEAGLFARIEGLVGQEAALLAVPERDRSEEQHERLRSIGAELDRVWAKLRERAERVGHHKPAVDSP
jgi:hypothetical protein